MPANKDEPAWLRKVARAVHELVKLPSVRRRFEIELRRWAAKCATTGRRRGVRLLPDRPLEPNEKFAALAAIHDEVRDRTRPWRRLDLWGTWRAAHDVERVKQGIPYAILCGRVAGLKNEDRDRVEEILADVRREFAGRANPKAKPQPATLVLVVPEPGSGAKLELPQRGDGQQNTKKHHRPRGKDHGLRQKRDSFIALMKQFISGEHPVRKGSPFQGTLKALREALEKDLGGRWPISNLSRWGATKLMREVGTRSPHRVFRGRNEWEAFTSDHDPYRPTDDDEQGAILTEKRPFEIVAPIPDVVTTGCDTTCHKFRFL